MAKAANKQKAKQTYKKGSSGNDAFTGFDQRKSGQFDPNSDLTVCETKDLVKVGLRADVFYSIADPEKCINRIDSKSRTLAWKFIAWGVLHVCF